jgi:hypothetical protein
MLNGCKPRRTVAMKMLFPWVETDDERNIMMTQDEYTALRRLLNIEYPISEAANWVQSQMYMEKQTHIDEMHGRGVEKERYTMRLEKPLAESVDVLAKKLNMKRSEAVREAIVDWLKKKRDV